MVSRHSSLQPGRALCQLPMPLSLAAHRSAGRYSYRLSFRILPPPLLSAAHGPDSVVAVLHALVVSWLLAVPAADTCYRQGAEVLCPCRAQRECFGLPYLHARTTCLCHALVAPLRCAAGLRPSQPGRCETSQSIPSRYGTWRSRRTTRTISSLCPRQSRGAWLSEPFHALV